MLSVPLIPSEGRDVALTPPTLHVNVDADNESEVAEPPAKRPRFA
jgi:hypothetical protein